MKTALSFAEIDELMYYSRLEADFAAQSVAAAEPGADRDTQTDRYCNARYLAEKLAWMRARVTGDRCGYLLPGAEVWGRQALANGGNADVVSLFAERKHAQQNAVLAGTLRKTEAMR